MRALRVGATALGAATCGGACFAVWLPAAPEHDSARGTLGIADAQSDPRSAAAALASDGALIVRNAMTREEFEGLRRAAVDAASRRPPVQMFRSRFHHDLRAEPELRRLVGASLCSERTYVGRLVAAHMRTGDLRLTQLQVVTARPGSDRQYFHVDNLRRGITLAVPLVDQDRAMGSTQLLLRTHRLVRSEKGEGADAPITPQRLALVSPEVPEAGVLVYDSRTWHRGMGNTSTVDRPVLIVRLDAPATPPPGIGYLGSTVLAVLGRALAAVLDERVVDGIREAPTPVQPRS